MKNTVLVHATCNYLKTVTNNVGWSAPSKTTIFGLKFVTVPLLAPIVYRKGVDAVAIAG